MHSKDNERLKAELIETKTQLAILIDGGREMIGVYDVIWQFSSKEGSSVVWICKSFLIIVRQDALKRLLQ